MTNASIVLRPFVHGDIRISVMANANIVLRPFVHGDIEFVENWLGQEHVRPWYPNPEDWLRELRAREGEFSFIHHLIVCAGGKPIGFCQYYRCEDSGEAEYEPYWRYDAYSVDYLIGEPDSLGRGVGKMLVSELVDLVFVETDAEAIVAQPASDNAVSRATLIANRFTRDHEHDVFIRWRERPESLLSEVAHQLAETK